MEGTPLYLLSTSEWHIFRGLWFRAVADPLSRVFPEKKQVYEPGGHGLLPNAGSKGQVLYCVYIYSRLKDSSLGGYSRD